MSVSFNRLGVGLALLILVAGVGVGAWQYHVLRAPNAADTTTAVSPAIAEQIVALGAIGEGTRTYKSDRYMFQLTYPQSLDVTEYTEVGNAISVTFQNPSNPTVAFQIYVTPYSDQQITESRFLRDEPSGVRRDPTEVLIDGVRALLFTGQNTVMGDTKEVWFIKNGFLYEVATYRERDTWLGEIMKTWKFL